MRWARMACGIGAAWMMAALACADVTSPPPPILFPNWQLESQTEKSEIYEVSFPSAIASEWPENDTVFLKVILPKNRLGAIPSVVTLHYWGARDQKAEIAFAKELNARGIAAILMTLPYHLKRTPPGHLSGDLAIMPDPKQLVRTMTQSVSDLRRTLDFIQSRAELDPNQIGVSGTSLGSIVATLSYAIDPRIKHASFVLGGADIAYIMWNSSRVVTQRDALRRQGYTEEKLREELKEIEPLNYLPSGEGRDAFVVGARYDTVVPAAATEKLIASLEKPKTLWLDTGHYGGFFVQNKLLRQLGDYFQASFANQVYQPPNSLHAPTIRLGVEILSDTGFDIGAGFDFWKGDVHGKNFGSAFFTPRGPHLFFGSHVDRSVAIGVSIGARRTSFGLLWSVEL